MPNPPLVVHIHYRAQPGKAAVARAELAALIAAVQSLESGCLGITLHQNRDTPDEFFLYERWTDRATYDGPHMTTPHLQAFIASAPQFLAGPPGITYWDAIDA